MDAAALGPNVKQVVPFFRIADMDRSLRFYVNGLGFALKNKWVVDEKIRWCWLELGGAALMLQTSPTIVITLSRPAANSAKASQLNFNASTPWPSTANSFLAASPPLNLKLGIPCGPPASPTLTVIAWGLKVSPTRPRIRNFLT